KLMEYSDLQQMNSFLEKYSIEERINKLGLKPDRADVITHAGNIFLQVMKEVGVKHVFVPKVGLADGVIQELYNKHIGNK
ncbi:MAG: exopolyphosphatase, partial [Flavobacteriales bacterium]|nr:exopolyphosphatase [Flavobacteriales bacterium]